MIKRLKAYVDSGADMIFPEGLATLEEFQQVAKEMKGYGPKGGPYLLANMTEFGKTPYIKLADFKSAGYNCVIYPVSTLRVAQKAVEDFLNDFKANETQEGFVPKMQTRQELYDLLKYKPGQEWIFPSSIRKI